jgi:hypothetical protein
VVVVVVLDFDALGLPQAQRDGPMHIDTMMKKTVDFILLKKKFNLNSIKFQMKFRNFTLDEFALSN